MFKICRVLSVVVAMSVSFSGLLQTAQAAPISTEQLAASQAIMTDSTARAYVLSALDRAEVVSALQERGVSPEQARARIAALSDTEVSRMAEQIDSAPAGAGDIVATIILVFGILLLTDILGYTKVFPMSRSAR
ncbi:MAG: PA2779 family protein [Burkholderiales bacterium]|jgi:hypothetical protein